MAGRTRPTACSISWRFQHGFSNLITRFPSGPPPCRLLKFKCTLRHLEMGTRLDCVGLSARDAASNYCKLLGVIYTFSTHFRHRSCRSAGSCLPFALPSPLVHTYPYIHTYTRSSYSFFFFFCFWVSSGCRCR